MPGYDLAAAALQLFRGDLCCLKCIRGQQALAHYLTVSDVMLSTFAAPGDGLSIVQPAWHQPNHPSINKFGKHKLQTNRVRVCVVLITCCSST